MRSRWTVGLVTGILVGVVVTMGPAAGAGSGPLFRDGFESGNLSKWAESRGISVQSNDVHDGRWAATASGANGAAFAEKRLTPAASAFYYRTWFKLESSSGGALLQVRSASGHSLFLLLVTARNTLATHNSVTGKTRVSAVSVTPGFWHDVQLHLQVKGTASRVGLWLDGLPVRTLSRADVLGTKPVSEIDIGDKTAKKAYRVVFDDVVANTAFIRTLRDPLIAAAGNIACDPSHPGFNHANGNKRNCRMKYVSNILVSNLLHNTGRKTAVLALGDNQYICGGALAFQESYGPTWGRVKSITHPVPGDKEYRSKANAPNGTDCEPPPTTAKPYFDYFGKAAHPPNGYYSFDLGTWHLIALNGNCYKLNGCGKGSAEEQWLSSDLAADHAACTLVYWHQPRFSSGRHGDHPDYADWWDDMYAAGVDVVLNAHDHDYERFAPQNPKGKADPAKGIREFIVGTGGNSLIDLPPTPKATSQVRQANTFGVLELVLHPTGYDWSFVPEAGKTFTDSGSGSCH